MIVPKLPLIMCDIEQGNLQQVTFNKAPNKMIVPKLILYHPQWHLVDIPFSYVLIQQQIMDNLNH